jgi:CRP/FNR family transcriptional regulator, cyclic AMP receptor protein
MPDSCLDCGRRTDCVFCDLAPEALAAFDGIKTAQTFPKGTILFREGHPARGIFLVCQGRVRLSVSSESGQRIVLRTASAGEVLGLSAALAATNYEVTAEVTENATVAQIRRKELLHFLRQHCDVCMQVVNQLSEDLHIAYDRVRAVGLGRPRRSHSTQIH